MSSINLVGSSLQNGKYTIEDELGRGGFGVTYRAIHQSLNQIVVIKTLRWADQESAQQLQTFQAEARRLAQCQHPNIVNVTDFFVEAERPYLVMDFIPGQPLSAMIFPDRPLSEALALGYIRQIAGALQTVHGQGLLHRDVKPQNIMVDAENAILIDFGIARELSTEQTQTHTNLVSEGYAPLEQYLPRARRSAASDVYGLAATLYSAVTGQVPVASVLRSHQPLTPPRQLNPQLSPGIDRAILQGMALELAQRPQSITTWLTLLDSASDPAAPAQKQRGRPSHSSTTQATQVVAPRRPTHSGITYDSPQTVAAEPSINTRVERPHRQGPGLFKTLLSVMGLGLLAGVGIAGYRLYTASQQSLPPLNGDELPEEFSPEVALPETTSSEATSSTTLPEATSAEATLPETDVHELDSTDGWIDLNEPIDQTEALTPSDLESLPPLLLANRGDTNTSAPGGGSTGVTIRGFAPGTTASAIANYLGEPTQQSVSPSATTAIYELDPNRATVAYVYDAAGKTVQRTEAAFAPSYDRLVMRVTLTGMLNHQSTPDIEAGLEQVRTGKIDQYPFAHNGLTGSIERNNNGFIHIHVR